MNFGEMLESLKEEPFAIARRVGWNGKGMAIAFIPEKMVEAGDVTPHTLRLLEQIERVNAGVPGAPPPRGDAPLRIDSYFSLWTAQGTWRPGWAPSSGDVLAEDWEVYLLPPS